MNTDSTIARLSYGGCQISAKVPSPDSPTSGAPTGGSVPPTSAATPFSMLATTCSASRIRPWRASQRGDSGSARRMNQTKIAPAEPNSTTQRQPSKPNGAIGTSWYAMNAITGTIRNWKPWLKA